MRDVGRRQRRRGDLVEQRHEEMEVAAVDERDVGRRIAERSGASETAETRADDDDAGLGLCVAISAALRFHVPVSVGRAVLPRYGVWGDPAKHG